MEEREVLSFFNEDGTMKNKDEVLKQIGEIYDNVKAEEDNSNEGDFFCHITDPECAINVEHVLETFNFTDRIIYLADEIGEQTGTQFMETIRFFNRVDEIDGIAPEERQPIKIVIDTPGGDLCSTLSIIDAIKLSKTPIWTITTGRGYSGGFFIGICGHKRFGFPNSTYLFHQGACSWSSDAHKFQQQAKFYERTLDTLRDITLKNTSIKEADYEKYKNGDWWLTAEDALAVGVIDEIAKDLI